jgi:uncharacterized YccA/Bax inhibitor family protein
MTQSTGSDTRIQNEMLQLLSVSGTLAGLCVTVVALINTLGRNTRAATMVDDMFAVCALLFLICIYLIFSALRVRRQRIAKILVKSVDILFMVAMTLMTGAAFIMVYMVL